MSGDPDSLLLLASASATRAKILAGAGVPFATHPAAIDESEIKRSLSDAGATASAAAETLAELKAVKVSARAAGRLVLGADQMLECEGKWFDKPAGRDEARATLEALSGRTHRLISAAVIARDGARIWHHQAEALLTMRPLSPSFLDHYLVVAGPALLESVGAYRLEELGAQLFTRIEGDYFTILGLPLLPLLDFLRNHSVMMR